MNSKNDYNYGKDVCDDSDYYDDDQNEKVEIEDNGDMDEGDAKSCLEELPESLECLAGHPEGHLGGREENTTT